MAAASAETIVFYGQKAVRAQTNELEMILVPGWGSNVVSLKSRVKNVELLRVPRSAEQYEEIPVLYGIPILFPPNRIEDGTFTFEGTTYHFNLNEPETNNHSHGLLFEEEWELIAVKQEGGRLILITEFDSVNYPQAMEQFPHHFVVRMTYQLEESTLRKTAAVFNKGNSPFPWGLGYHTTFNFPFRNGDSLSNCTFSLTADKRWELNSRFLPTGTLQEIEYGRQLNEGMSLEGCSLDDAFLSSVVHGGDSNQVVLVDRNVGIKLVYACDDHFKHWVIYNDDGKQGYVCPEPYTWVTNAPNLSMDRQITGVQVLQPGEETTVSSTISIFVDS